MAQSLNEYASRVAHIVGQPDNQSLKERVKQMFKDYFAKYLIQSIDRNGISPYYKLSLIIGLNRDPDYKVINPLHDRVGDLKQYTYTSFIAKNIPMPMNIKNDSPFTRVTSVLTGKNFSYCSPNRYRIASSLVPTGCPRLYTYSNNNLMAKYLYPMDDLQTFPDNITVELEGIFENPEEVIALNINTINTSDYMSDMQDFPLPFPNEMMSFIIAEILKVEFGIMPKDVDIIKE